MSDTEWDTVEGRVRQTKAAAADLETMSFDDFLGSGHAVHGTQEHAAPNLARVHRVERPAPAVVDGGPMLGASQRVHARRRVVLAALSGEPSRPADLVARLGESYSVHCTSSPLGLICQDLRWLRVNGHARLVDKRVGWVRAKQWR